MGAPQVMHRREESGEEERHHRAFLLYAMQSDKARSLRAVARAVGASDNSVRKWRVKHEWDARVGDPEVCRHACDLFAELYHKRLGGKDVAVIEERLGAEYKPPGHEEKSELARSVDLYEQVTREEELARFNKESKERSRKLRMVLDATLARIGQGLASGDLKPRPGDMGHIIRGFEVMEKAEQRRLAMLPSARDDDQGEGSSVAVPTSQRVLQARAQGRDELEALEEDAEELLLILRAVREHERESNVLTFGGGRAAGGG